MISQDPISGTQVAVGSAVKLVVSTGPAARVGAGCCQPDAGRGDQRDHRSQSDRRHDQHCVECDGPGGTVISQNPGAGTQVAVGSAVNLVVSTGPPPVSVPSVVNLTQAAATSAITERI